MIAPAAQRPVKRSVSLYGHRTSVTLEPPFWAVLERMAAARGQSVNALVGGIDAARPPDVTLSGALRVAALTWALERGVAEGAVRAAPPA